MTNLREKIGIGMIAASSFLILGGMTTEWIKKYKYNLENPYKKQTIIEIEKSEEKKSNLEFTLNYANWSKEYNECIHKEYEKENKKIDSIKYSKDYKNYLKYKKNCKDSNLFSKNEKWAWPYILLTVLSFYGGLLMVGSEKEENS